jgi:hypothetical protein
MDPPTLKLRRAEAAAGRVNPKLVCGIFSMEFQNLKLFFPVYFLIVPQKALFLTV